MDSAYTSTSSVATKHQVFLSFRGEDTRYNFTGHLLKALKDSGIKVSFDIKEKVVKKEEIRQALSDEIAASNLSIIVLSKGYAFSESCLDELSVIMDRKRSQEHVVLPIFYHVDPSHVGTPSGRHKSKKWPDDDALKQWKSALVEVSKLKGWHIEGGKFDRPETEHIKDIVGSVKQKLVMKHQVFLSLGEDTRRNFTSHLLKALKDKGISVFFDEEKVENRGQVSPTLSQAIATSNLSIVVLSKDYASSKSCLAELSCIMYRKSNHGLIVFPIFYHVVPSDVRNIGGSFNTSFDDHESNTPLDEVKRWKAAFAEAGTLKGCCIGGKFNRRETEYIKEIVEDVIKELVGVDDQKRTISSEEIVEDVIKELVGVDDQKKTISSKEIYEDFIEELLGVDDQKKTISSVIDKTNLDDAIYKEGYPKFEDHCSLHVVSRKIEKRGRESPMASYSSSPLMEHEVFLSFRGEDTRLNFTSHLLRALEDTGISVFFDEEKLESGEHILPAFSQAIEASRLFIIVLSSNYASSRLCLAELSHIMDCRSSHGQAVLPIFYHVDPSDVQHIRGSFNASFKHYETQRLHQVKQWKAAFAEVGKLEGWHIKGGKFDRSESEYIKKIVEFVIENLMNSDSISVSELVGANDQKETISSVISKTTPDDAIHEEVSSKFEDTYLLQNVGEKTEKQGTETSMTSSSLTHQSSSLTDQSKFEVFLSFRGEDTRLSFTSHLHKALKDVGINVFFNEETLEKGEQLTQALSRAIAASNLSIIVLSAEYAASNTCLSDLSDIMDCKNTQGHVVLPIFYHVDPSNIRQLSGCFKTYFEEHESNRPFDEVKRWKTAFVEVGKLKGWHIEGNKFDRPESEYINDIVEYVIKKLMNSYSRRVSEKLVGIDDQKNTILELIEQKDCHVIGLWGMCGIGKTTLAEAVYNEISLKFQSRCFLTNVSEEVKNKGMESVRSDLLSELLDKKSDIVTRSIGSDFIQERPNKGVIVVLDDVDDPDQIDLMGVKFFGHGSKIIVTSRDRQALKNGGAHKIHEVRKLNENESLVLFSTFAFKQLNPTVDFQDLSNKFVRYAQGNPLVLKVLGSRLYAKSREVWEIEVDKLKKYSQPLFSQIMKSSFDGLDELEQNIFLDIACFFKGEYKENVEEILSCSYKDAMFAINNLLDKCLIDITDGYHISMHGMLEQMGKDIVSHESYNPGERSRLWNPKDVHQVLKYNKGTQSIKGIKLDMSDIDNLWIHHSAFVNMLNLRYIQFYDPHGMSLNKKFYTDGADIVYLPSELRYLRWDYYPFQSLPSSFNPKNLAVLRSWSGKLEQLWNENDCQDLGNLREIDLSNSKNLRKISNLSGAVNLKILCCNQCESLVELPCLNNLTSLERLELSGCKNLRRIPNLSGATNLKILCCNQCESLVEFPCLVHLTAHKEVILLSFLNCFRLNQDSVRNIESNAMFQIQSLAERWASRKLRRDSRIQKKYFCCFPGSEISENDFEYQSVNSSLKLKIIPSSRSESRFLAFAICLVANLTCVKKALAFNCEYQLTVAGGEMFKDECRLYFDMHGSITGDHVFILFSEDMIRINHDYDEVSFKVNIENIHDGKEIGVDDIKVEKCGVHVFYVDAESDGNIEEVVGNFDSHEDYDTEEVHDYSAREMRPAGHKRSFSYEGDRVPKRWK